MYSTATRLIDIPVALVFVNSLYLVQALLAYFYVEYLKLRTQLADIKLVQRHEMYDWTAKFQITSGNIIFFRRVAWNVLFFCVLAFGATIALQELFRTRFGGNGIEKTAAVILSTAILDVGLYYALHYQYELRRERLKNLKLHIIRGYNMKNVVYVRNSFDQIRPLSSFFADSSLTLVSAATVIVSYLCVLYFTLAS